MSMAEDPNDGDPLALHWNIVNRRRAAGLNQTELAAMLGVTRQTVSRWETGESMPERRHLRRLSEVFASSSDALFAPMTTVFQCLDALHAATKKLQEQVARIEQRVEALDERLDGLADRVEQGLDQAALAAAEVDELVRQMDERWWRAAVAVRGLVSAYEAPLTGRLPHGVHARLSKYFDALGVSTPDDDQPPKRTGPGSR